jgi:hypothetical protein
LEALTAKQQAGWTAQTVPELAADLPEVLELADRVGDPATIVLACCWGFNRMIETGNTGEASLLLEKARRVANELNNPALDWIVTVREASLFMFDGPGDTVDRIATAALKSGLERGQTDAFTVYTPQLIIAREMQGRLRDIVDVLREQVESTPGLPGLRAVLAYVDASIGRHKEAADAVKLLGVEPDPLPFDQAWLMGHAFFAEAIAIVGPADYAEWEYRRLLPYVGRVPSTGGGGRPTVDFLLGVLARRAGWPDTAERHLTKALQRHASMGAGYWVARTHMEMARLAIAEGAHEVARERLRLTVEAAEPRQAIHLLHAADALMAGLVPN